MNTTSTFLLFFCMQLPLLPLSVYGQHDNNLVPDKVYSENIKTVLLHRKGWELSAPVILLNSGEKIQLSFDVLNQGVTTFTYTIIHCNSDWEPSPLQPYEYISGFTEETIYEYSFSRNTLIPYIHYTAEIPGEYMKPAISGNYLLKVWGDNTDDICFVKRFMVTETAVDISATVKPSSIPDERRSKQQIRFTINTGNARIDNPFRNLKVVITQNGRFETALHGLQPVRVVGNSIDYNHDHGNVFDGGNEYRFFEFRNFNLPSERTGAVERGHDGYHVTLKTDERRSFQVYKTFSDINGRFKVDCDRSDDPATEADYAYVSFRLSLQFPLAGGEMHLFGDFCKPPFGENSRMTWNFKDKAYEKTLLLKQGYYNYLYVMLPADTNIPDVTFIEGNHSETENEYAIYVYYYDLSLNCELLKGVKHINSLPEKR